MSSKLAQAVMDGLVLGDGRITRGEVALRINSTKDHDLMSSEIGRLIMGNIPGLKSLLVKTTITKEELVTERSRCIPDRFLDGDRETKIAFLRGLFSANGSVAAEHDNWVALRQTSAAVIYDARYMLKELGLSGYVVAQRYHRTPRAAPYTYTLQVTPQPLFRDTIGFIQTYRNAALAHAIARLA